VLQDIKDMTTGEVREWILFTTSIFSFKFCFQLDEQSCHSSGFILYP